MSLYSYLLLRDPSKNYHFLVLKPEELPNTLTNVNATPPDLDLDAAEAGGLLHGLIVEAPLSAAAERGFFELPYC
jgi:hypothetical protein